MFQPKRFRDILLEHAVLNFHEIFLERVTDSRRVIARKDILLPCGLFESILDKNREIHWTIPISYLKLCLAAIDELRWENIDLTDSRSRDSNLDENDIKIISESRSTVRSLCFYAKSLPSNTLRYLSKVRGLETLDIKANSFEIHYNNNETEQPEKIKLANLKKLSISGEAVLEDFMSNIDLEKSSRSLKTLLLTDIEFDYRSESVVDRIPFLQSIGSFVNLRHFALNGTWRHKLYSKHTLEMIFKELKKLKYLKTFEFRKWRVSFEAFILLADLLKNVKSIENLEVGESSFALKRYKWMNGRRLKYLGIHYSRGIVTPLVYDEDTLARNQAYLSNINAERIAGKYNIETLMTCLEAYIEKCIHPASVICYFPEENEWISDLSDDMLHRLEAILIKVLHKYINSTCYVAKETLLLLKRIHREQQLSPTTMKKICLVALSSSICDPGHIRHRWDRDIYKLLRGEEFLPHVLEFVKKDCNSFIVKAFLNSNLWCLDERLDRGPDVYRHMKNFGTLKFLEELKNEDRLDEEAKGIIKNILHRIDEVKLNIDINEI